MNRDVAEMASELTDDPSMEPEVLRAIIEDQKANIFNLGREVDEYETALEMANSTLKRIYAALGLEAGSAGLVAECKIIAMNTELAEKRKDSTKGVINK